MRIVYAGTPEFAVPALSAVLADPQHHIVAAYTQPDRPAGRGRQLAASPVKQRALAAGVAVEQPLNFRDDAAVEQLRSYQPDVMVVAAYGLILPQRVLDIPTHGCINIHASLLPRWRGAAPIQRAILAGDTHTGITIMRMEAGLDTGPMLLSECIAIGAHDNAALIHDQLATLGAQLIVTTLTDLPAQLAHAMPQPTEGVTYAKKLSKDEALIDWSQPAAQIDRQVRAFNPWPVAETRLHGQQLRIWQAEVIARLHQYTSGTVLEVDARGIHVACGQDVLCLKQVQQAGRKTLSATEFTRAHDLAGMCLGIPL
jgi:methionyl-tRNA formyltransferase